MGKTDGMNYAPQGRPAPVVTKNEFFFSVAGLEHGHIYGMTNGLLEAGATIKYVYDRDAAKAEAFCAKYPCATPVPELGRILQDNETRLVAAAAIPNERGPLGVKVMEHGKHYFTDKTPFTELKQLEAARAAVKRFDKKYMVYYSERLHVECAVHAGRLIKDGVIGGVIQVLGTGPHRLNIETRPDWFFKKEQYGGILCDIGSHQIEQYLYFSGETDAEVVSSRVGNFNNPLYPEFEDFGDASLTGANGTANYFRVDWFTPDGLDAWGDGRTFILGTKGYIELRKYTDVGVSGVGDNIVVVTGDKTEKYNVSGQVGFPYFGELILDCVNGTENAMTQRHAFKAAELCLLAQEKAARIGKGRPQNI